ncbi:MAG: radical SAM family protein [Burkholderiales bacterium]
MGYSVREIFYTLQGEGANTGRPAVFLRFAGCNLWSGREQDRADAVCRFCDTEFVGIDGEGGGKFETPAALAAAVEARWPAPSAAWPAPSTASPAPSAARPAPSAASPVPGTAALVPDAAQRFVVCTGGEPLLQLDSALVAALRGRGFTVAVETNGTLAAPAGELWLTVSPKAGAPLALTQGDELKLVYPQTGAEPERYAQLQFRHFFLQPMDGPDKARNTRLATAYCLAHPGWRLSLQTHKLIGIR